MKSHYKGDLISALLHTFKWEYASSFTIGCIQRSFDMLKPFMVQKTIMFIQDPESKENGYAMVAALVASEIIQYMLGQHQHFMNCNTGWKVSKVLTQMVFSK